VEVEVIGIHAGRGGQEQAATEDEVGVMTMIVVLLGMATHRHDITNTTIVECELTTSMMTLQKMQEEMGKETEVEA